MTSRFRQFHASLDVTKEQAEDALGKFNSIVGCLNRSYYGATETEGTALLVGSWDKCTLVAPPDDLDIYFLPPISEFHRFDAYEHNGQSALLQDVKNRLKLSHSQTEMSGDGQVVVVDFNSLTVELAPAFWRGDGKLLIPDTNDLGSWRVADPIGEKQALNLADLACNGNVRPILRMSKVWRDFAHVPLRSFQLELLVQKFLLECRWRLEGYFYYDWIVRDFFEFLLSQRDKTLTAPGTLEQVTLGSNWVSRAQSAYNAATAACEHEYADRVVLAGIEWQKIFGNRIPFNP